MVEQGTGSEGGRGGGREGVGGRQGRSGREEGMVEWKGRGD